MGMINWLRSMGMLAWRERVAPLYRVIRKSHVGKMTSEQRTGRKWGRRPWKHLGKIFPGRGNRNYKGPESEAYWPFIEIVRKTGESKEIQPVHPKGYQSWVFFGRTDAEAETPILWPPHAKSWLIGKGKPPLGLFSAIHKPLFVNILIYLILSQMFSLYLNLY